MICMLISLYLDPSDIIYISVIANGAFIEFVLICLKTYNNHSFYNNTHPLSQGQ